MTLSIDKDINAILAKKEPLISVIMPAYNAEKYIQQAIDSILNQTHQNFELLIADNASTDKTRQIIDSYTDARIKKFHNNSNLGYLKNCNKLLSLAKGDYIAFQDADDISSFNRLEKQLKVLLNNDGVDVVGSNMTAIDIYNNEKFCTYYLLEHDSILKQMPHYFSVIPNSFLLKRKVYDEIGGYNEFFDGMGAEDYYWTYLIMEKFKLINMNEPLYVYRYNPVSITGDWSDNINKMFSFKIVGFLINQRRSSGTDALESKKTEPLDNYIAELKKPYKDDPSLFYRELATKYFYEGLRKRALKLSLTAIINKPFKLKNYRDLFYYLRF